MGKTLKYVSEFSFPSDKGYSGSAGKTMVKGYARGGSCGPMKKADGGMVDDPRRPMMDRTVGEYINAVNRERAMEMADMMAAERAAALLRAPRRISQGLRSPRAEMARERAIMGEDAGYKKGGMAMRKQYPTNNGKPMISGPKAAPAPKADMLYSKKEVNAKNLLRDGKAPALPHAKGSVNMKSGGPVKKAMGGAMPPGVSLGAARPGQPQQPLSQQALQMLQGKRPAGQPQQLLSQQALQMLQGKRPAGLTQSQMQAADQGRRPGGSIAFNKLMSDQDAAKAAAQSIRSRGVGGAMPKPGQVGSATGSTPNIGGVPGRVMAKGGAAKVGKVMREFKAGELHSGSKSGPVVKSRKQAIAIGLSEARRGKK
jgi:hypothetical protein